MEKGSSFRRCIYFSLQTTHENKLLHWQNDGFVIYSKRLEKGTFELPKDDSIEITAHELQFILDGIFLSSIIKRVRYQHHFVSKIAVESGVSARV
jgi:hypothetical protein